MNSTLQSGGSFSSVVSVPVDADIPVASAVLVVADDVPATDVPNLQEARTSSPANSLSKASE